MHFEDPLTVTCHECETKSSQRVADLWACSAACPACGSSLAEVGREMRAAVDQTNVFWAALVILELALPAGTVNSATLKEASRQTKLTLCGLIQFAQQSCPEFRTSHLSIKLIQAIQLALPELNIDSILGKPLLEWVDRDTFDRLLDAGEPTA